MTVLDLREHETEENKEFVSAEKINEAFKTFTDDEKRLFYQWAAVEDGELKVCCVTPPEFDALYERFAN